MDIGTTAPSFSAGLANLLFPQQGVTAEGRTIWGFTVEQLSAPDGQMVMMPVLSRAFSPVGLREQLLQVAQREAEQERRSPAPSFRGADGQPQFKVRKAVLAEPRAGSEGKATEQAKLMELAEQAARAACQTGALLSSPRKSNDSKSSREALPALPPLPHPPAPEEVKRGQALRAAMKDLLRSGATEARLLEVFKAHRRWGVPADIAKPAALQSGFLVALFESLPALREEPDDRRTIGRALGLIRSAGGGHFEPASLAQLRRALEFVATAGTVAPDLIAQLLLDANTTGKSEKSMRSGAIRPRNQFTQNSGQRGFAQPMVDMFVAQSRQKDIQLSDLCESATLLSRMFAQDTRHPTGETLFTHACSALGLDSADLAKVLAAFTAGRTSKPVAAAGRHAPSKEEVPEGAGDCAETNSDEAQESEVESSGIAVLRHGMSALPALIPIKPRAGTSSSSSSR